MQFQIESYISDKNNWLSKQVDVEFPTPESLIGRQLYLASQQDITFTESNIESLLKTKGDLEVIEVDFHRLTILFSIIQASLWSDTPADERFIIEFLTQIILDDDYQLYLGFHEREPVSALICHIDQKIASRFYLISLFLKIGKVPLMSKVLFRIFFHTCSLNH